MPGQVAPRSFPLTLGQTLGFGAAGAGVGALAAPMIFGGGRNTAIGGALGAGLGAIGGGALAGTALFPGIGTGVGALIGGGLGLLAGGGLGSLFGGGGGGEGNEATLGRGRLGKAGAGGEGAAAKFLLDFDQDISEILDLRQLELANAALENARSISVKYSETPSAADLDRLARTCIKPTAEALGFNAAAIAVGTYEQQLENLEEAIDVQETIEGFSLTPLAAELRDIDTEFTDLADSATKYGISLGGLAEEQAKAEAAATRLANAEFFDASAAVGAISANERDWHALQIAFQEAEADAVELGISTDKLADAWGQANGELMRAQKAEWFEIAEAVGSISTFERDWQDLQLAFQDADAKAIELGISTDKLTDAWGRANGELLCAQTSEWIAVAE